jgi:riboflavin-specific deaminase-like protein
MNLGIALKNLRLNQQKTWSEEGRPWVTLSYAQSLDGSLSTARGRPTALSGAESLKVTHQLRAMHDAILVGVGTVLADDPGLTVRQVEGVDPRPVVLDSGLRFPLKAKLMGQAIKPWIFCAAGADAEKREALKAAGAEVIAVGAGEVGLDLGEVLGALGKRGVRSVMVEGGARVIGAFLAAGLVDWALITIAPTFIGGLKVVEELLPGAAFPRLVESGIERVGEDVVIWGSMA